MRYDVCILSEEESFARMLVLELTDRGRRTVAVQSEAALPSAELYLVDADRFPTAEPLGRTLRYGYSLPEDTENGLRRPFLLTALVEAATLGEVRKGLVLLPQESSVRLDGLRIRLTPLEYALLSRLAEENGRPVSRQVLYADVFGGHGDIGAVNVYIHYLRRKLEQDGRRLILARRGQGYALRREEDEG